MSERIDNMRTRAGSTDLEVQSAREMYIMIIVSCYPPRGVLNNMHNKGVPVFFFLLIMIMIRMCMHISDYESKDLPARGTLEYA